MPQALPLVLLPRCAGRCRPPSSLVAELPFMQQGDGSSGVAPADAAARSAARGRLVCSNTWACCFAEAFGLKQEQALEGVGGAEHSSVQVLELLVQLGAPAAGGLGPWQLIEEGVHLLARHRHQRQPLRW